MKMANPITMVAAVAPKSIADKINVLTPAGVPNIQDEKLKKAAMIGYGTAIAAAGGVAFAAYGGTSAIIGAAGKAGALSAKASAITAKLGGAGKLLSMGKALLSPKAAEEVAPEGVPGSADEGGGWFTRFLRRVLA